MKVWLVAIHIALVGTNLWVGAHFNEELSEDNEFAEFEDFDDEKLKPAIPLNDRISEQFKEVEIEDDDVAGFAPADSQPDEEDEDEDGALVEDADGEFDHFQDEEEFEGLDNNGRNAGAKQEEPSTLTITKVPLHLRARWDSFYLEILMVAGLLVYFVNYIAGRSKNSRIAESWFAENSQILQENFSLVGDTGRSREDSSESCLVKESESQYSLYCSGRVGCDSMLVELKLIKRQDLVAVLAQLGRPQNDQAHIRIELSKDESDNFVLAVATKKTAIHLTRDIADIALYCPEKRPSEKFGLPPGFFVMSEIAEAASAILDTRLIQAFAKYSQYIDYIHISDQYSGPKQQELVFIFFIFFYLTIFELFLGFLFDIGLFEFRSILVFEIF